MVKKIRVFSIISFSIVALLIVGNFVYSTFLMLRYNKINIFENISECTVLDDLKVSEKSLSDKYIGDISYNEKYAHRLNYNSNKFNIYAYEFENIESATAYYLTFKPDATKSDPNYNGESNGFFSRLIVRDGINVYRIECGSTQEYIEIMNYLNSIFSVVIKGRQMT